MPLSSATASLVALRQLCKAHGHWYELLHSGDGTLLHRRRQEQKISVLAQPSGEALLHTTNLLCLLPRDGKSSPSSGNYFNSVTLL